MSPSDLRRFGVSEAFCSLERFGRLVARLAARFRTTRGVVVCSTEADVSGVFDRSTDERSDVVGAAALSTGFSTDRSTDDRFNMDADDVDEVDRSTDERFDEDDRSTDEDADDDVDRSTDERSADSTDERFTDADATDERFTDADADEVDRSTDERFAVSTDELDELFAFSADEDELDELFDFADELTDELDELFDLTDELELTDELFADLDELDELGADELTDELDELFDVDETEFFDADVDGRFDADVDSDELFFLDDSLFSLELFGAVGADGTAEPGVFCAAESDESGFGANRFNGDVDGLSENRFGAGDVDDEADRSRFFLDLGFGDSDGVGDESASCSTTIVTVSAVSGSTDEERDFTGVFLLVRARDLVVLDAGLLRRERFGSVFMSLSANCKAAFAISLSCCLIVRWSSTVWSPVRSASKVCRFSSTVKSVEVSESSEERF